MLPAWRGGDFARVGAKCIHLPETSTQLNRIITS